MRRPTIPYRWLVAAVYVVGLFMDLLDTTVVYVALPTLGREFGASHTTLEWVVTGYLLSLAVWIPASGWLGDRFGTRRVFLWALALFTLGSALCGLAPNLEGLIAARVLQGIGGGMLTPVGAAMLFRAFPPEERARAAAVATVPAALAPTLGPVLGGFLVDTVGWRWIFWVNVPIGIAGLFFARAVLREHREARAGAFDLRGFLLAGAALPLLLFALAEAPQTGWGSAAVLGPGLASLALLALLARVELGRPHPMLDLRLLADRAFLGPVAVFCAAVASVMGVLFVLPLHLQEGRGLTALESGLTTFPQALGLILVTPLAGRLYLKVGARRLIAVGMAGTALGTLPFLWVDLGTGLWWLRGLMLLRGLAAGLVLVTVQAATFSGIRSRDLGRASALFQTGRQTAASLGVAIVATVIAHGTTTAGGRSVTPAAGFHDAYLAALVLALLGLATVLLVRTDRPAARVIPLPTRTEESIAA